MDTIKIIQGDITKASVDAIVNAANSQMLGGGGVDGAIHRAAGPDLLEACKKIKPKMEGIRCPVGEARITPAGNLTAKYVIHAVGPRYSFDKNPENLLASAYQNSLDLAVSHGCVSIAFPAISCGVYGYPLQNAAKIAVSVCKRPEYKALIIYFYLFSQEIAAIWMDEMDNTKNIQKDRL
ncbi:MAG: O-acetyl-ADP-ribose deacetylase [Desulfobacteraceae bacterium]|nr:O-acetyl-ADP-ribose deacetylase [Desulfobacteraceae bacterium]